MSFRQELSRHGIGASEIAAIAGLNPYASPWGVWPAKTGQSTVWATVCGHVIALDLSKFMSMGRAPTCVRCAALARPT